MTFDIMSAVNMVFGLVIFASGLYCYMRMKSVLSLYLGAAFGLFAITHFLTFIGMGTELQVPLAVARTIGYMTIIMGLYIKLKPAPAAKKRK
jgi:uncharacterized membrane protein (UPF0136 family)